MVTPDETCLESKLSVLKENCLVPLSLVVNKSDKFLSNSSESPSSFGSLDISMKNVSAIDSRKAYF